MFYFFLNFRHIFSWNCHPLFPDNRISLTRTTLAFCSGKSVVYTRDGIWNREFILGPLLIFKSNINFFLHCIVYDISFHFHFKSWQNHCMMVWCFYFETNIIFSPQCIASDPFEVSNPMFTSIYCPCPSSSQIETQQ